MFAALGVLLFLAVGCGDSCFEESTLVRTPDGRVSIGDLNVGDAVTSLDPSTGVESTTRVARVSHTWAWCEKLMVGGQSVWLTEEHPLYSPELSGFSPAESWLTGTLDQTLSEDGVLVVTKGGSWFEQRPCRVVDLMVDAEPHTFVAAGIVVHNKSYGCTEDRHCLPGDVCNEFAACVPAGGTGGSGGEGGASGQGGMGGVGGS